MTCPEGEGLRCVAWGDLGDFPWHMDCPVVLMHARNAAVPVTGPLPQVCRCECKTCKRAWEREGRPIVREGEIVRRWS